MKKLMASLVAAACLLNLPAAHASVFTLNFEASDFPVYDFGFVTAPQTDVVGSITYTAAVQNAPVTAIDAVDLVIAGHTYALANVDHYSFYEDSIFHGWTVGPLGLGVGLANFNLDFDGANVRSFSYTVDNYNIWQAGNITSTVVQQTVSAVPEPGTVPLLLAGFGVLWLRLRHKASAPSTGAATVTA